MNRYGRTKEDATTSGGKRVHHKYHLRRGKSFKEEIVYSSKDISIYGAKIQGNIPLPVGTIIKIDITLNNLQQRRPPWKS